MTNKKLFSFSRLNQKHKNYILWGCNIVIDTQWLSIGPPLTDLSDLCRRVAPVPTGEVGGGFKSWRQWPDSGASRDCRTQENIQSLEPCSILVFVSHQTQSRQKVAATWSPRSMRWWGRKIVWLNLSSGGYTFSLSFELLIMTAQALKPKLYWLYFELLLFDKLTTSRTTVRRQRLDNMSRCRSVAFKLLMFI